MIARVALACWREEEGREGEGEGGNTCHLVDGLCCMGYEFCEWLFFPNMVTNNYVYNHK